MKKKSKLIYSIMICFLAYVVLSWLLPTGSMSSGALSTTSRNPIGLGGLFYYPTLTFGTFIQFGLIVLAIGGLYGVMQRTGAYSKLIENTVKKFESKKNLVLILTIVILALVSSISGCPFAMLIVIPFIVEVLLQLGYSKLTAVCASVGSLLIGEVGSTFGYTIAGSAATTLGINIYSGLLSRIILLVLVSFIFIMFVLSRKNNKDEEKITLFYEKESTKDVKRKVRVTPLLVLFILTLVISILGMFSWSSVLNITFFQDFNAKVSALTIKDFPLISNLLGLSATFGNWDSYELVGIVLFAALVIGWVYSLKLSEIFDSFIDGAKKLMKPAMYVTIANIIFTLMLVNQNNNILVWILGKLNGLAKGFNIILVILSSMITGLFYNVFPYFFYNLSAVLTGFYTSEYYNIIMFVGQSVYSILMMILPTSIFLIAGLSLLDISYKDWVKYIWKFLLEILGIVIIISIILALLV